MVLATAHTLIDTHTHKHTTGKAMCVAYNNAYNFVHEVKINLSTGIKQRNLFYYYGVMIYAKKERI